MHDRLALHEILCDILGSRNVYFQPPESLKMNYPAIVYSRSNIANRFANNRVYSSENQYEVVVIDKDPDSTIPERLNRFHAARFVRHYTADQLNHDVFSIYY